MWVSGGQCACWVAGSASRFIQPHSQDPAAIIVKASAAPFCYLPIPVVTEDQQGTWLTWATPPRGIPPHLASELVYLQQMGNEDSVRFGSNHSLNG